MANRKTPDQQLEALTRQRAQLDARIQKKKAQVRGAQRKQETRRKIIAGALALEHAQNNPQFEATLKQLLQQNVTRPEDRKLFDI